MGKIFNFSNKTRLVSPPRDGSEITGLVTYSMNDGLNDYGIQAGDHLLIDENAKVFNGDLALIESMNGKKIFLVEFPGDEIIKLIGFDGEKIFDRSEIEIKGRVIRIERDL